MSVYGNLYGLLYIPADADKLVTSPEDALMHARAVQRIMRFMLLGLETPDESTLGDEELLIHLSWYAESWTLAASRLLEAERSARAATQAQTSAVPQSENVTDLMGALKRSIARKRKAGA